MNKIIKKCKVCGKEFHGYPNSKYCSEKCRNTKIPEYKHVGNIYGQLKVISEYRQNSILYCLCQCSCGQELIVRCDCLESGSTKSCGHVTRFKKYHYKGIKNPNGVEIIQELNNDRLKCKCPICGKEFVTARKRVNNMVSCGCKSVKTAMKNIKGATEKYCIEGTDVRALTKNMQRNNKSGVKGVSWDKSRNKWTAQITFKGKNYYLGRYEKIEDAIFARKEAEEKIFGEFLKWYENERKGNNKKKEK